MFKNSILINIDGCRRELLYRLLDEGRLPVLGSIFNNGMRFSNASTVFPTATFPTQASAITSVYPKNHGVLSNTWMDRQKDDCPLYNYTENFFHAARVYKYSLLGFPSIFFAENGGDGMADEHLSSSVKTVYQEAKGAGISSMTAFHQFVRGADKWVRPKPLDMIGYFFGNIYPDFFRHFDESMVSRVIKELEKGFLPGILFLYFAASDGAGHWRGEAGQEWYLTKVVEEKLGRIIKTLEKKRGLDSTLFVLFSDHGHSDVANDKAHCVPLRDITDVLRQFKGCDKISTEETHGKNCVLALEGGMVAIYVKSRNAVNWKTHAEPDELEPVCGKFAEKLKVRLGAIVFKDTAAGEYRLFPGENPMDLPLEKIVAKINREYWTANSPDIMLFSNYADGYHFYKDPLMAIHGNISPTDFNIPLLMAGEGIASTMNDDEVGIVDITPTVASLMGFRMEKTDGRQLQCAMNNV